MYNCQKNSSPETNGAQYIEYENRSGNESIVYFTRDLSQKGLIKAYQRINGTIYGKIAIKLHTGEPHGPNIIPPSWVEALVKTELPNATIIETNTYYEGNRFSTEKHRKTLKTNGWTFCPVDIIDEEGATFISVNNGKWFSKISLGKNIINYDSLVVLTHFKGHAIGGFGGSNKNIGIGMADGRIGKAMIHSEQGSNNMWGITKETFMERMTESSKATLTHFGQNICFVNVMRNMSVSCDCEGIAAQPVVTPNVGILASTDILAIDQACIDIIYSMKETDNHNFIERVESRHGLRQLSYMKELGMGNDRYILIDLDNNDQRIYPKDAIKDIKPFTAE